MSFNLHTEAMSSDQLTTMQRLALRALVPDGTAGDVQHRLGLACAIGIWAVPALLGAAAVWRRFWVIAGVQACLLLSLAWLW
jgi:hypothetical protein